MNTKHTPGPWEAVDSITVRGPYRMGDSSAPGFLIATLAATTPDDERKANASLIAAAPELLEVATDAQECAEILLCMIDSIRANGNYSVESTLIFLSQAYQCLTKVRPAIAKATGEQQ